MRKKLLRLSLAFLVSVMPALPMLAQIPEGYYSSLKGKKGAELKTAIHDLIKKANVLSYGSGNGHTWWGFCLPTVMKEDTSSTVTLRNQNGKSLLPKVLLAQV